MIIPDIKKSPLKVFIYYTVVSLALFGVINCIGLIHSLSIKISFLFILLSFLIAGIIHIYLIRIFFTDLNSQKKLLFTFAITILGILVLFLLNFFIFIDTSLYFYTLGLILFPLPFLFIYSLKLYLNIPDKIFKKWHYPMDHTMPNLDLLDLTKVLIIQFEFLKSANETTLTNFKAKAPYNMPFSELFYIFINDYNESHPQNIIEVTNEQQIPYAWIFRKKSSWWKSSKYVDPDLTFQNNIIINNDIIICQRVNQ